MFTWSDFLDIATELAGRAGDEAAERTAIGRAYYIAFGAARDYLIRTSVTVPKPSHAHTLAWDQFHAIADTRHRRIADRGRNLRDRRSHADYDLVYVTVSTDARAAVDMARSILGDPAHLVGS